MAKNLLIVESPAKAKTIKKFLGPQYEVMASSGHVRDLPKSTTGVDVDNDFEPKYITIRGKGELLAALRKAVKKADKVYLATDPDREGEAISWHLSKALKLEDKNYKRITFNEITKKAVQNSIKEAREINMDLVDAQQARRVIDRFVGYEISPLLWTKIKRGLSAGRVQSVALSLICDREAEIDAFLPKEYFTLDASFTCKDVKKPVIAHYAGTKDGKIASKEELDEMVRKLDQKTFSIVDVKESQRSRKQPQPFTTSTMQQEAARKCNFTTSKTMRIAQQLYEGVDIKGKGTVGLITYLRTDSVRISDEAHAAAKTFIAENYGTEYVVEDSMIVVGKKNIQDAHEAIRPTNLSVTPASLSGEISNDQLKLYKLIYNRFLASRMQPAVYTTTTVKLEAEGYPFRASASKLTFDGFMAVYAVDNDDDKDANKSLAGISMNSQVALKELLPEQHFTQPPAHYTEASLVRTLEELGIGRPSTYAPTISTILARRYIVKENKNLFVTELGEAVNKMMQQAFPVIIDVNFTANLETLFDQIEDGNMDWKTVVRNFYPDLHEAVMQAQEELEKVEIADEVSDEPCDLCGRMMVIKYGPHGKFLGCPGFPECRNTKPFFEKIGVSCPQCGKDIAIKMSKKGRRYYGCLGFPECDFMSWLRPSETKCPVCGSYMVEKGNKLMCQNDACKHVTDKKQE